MERNYVTVTVCISGCVCRAHLFRSGWAYTAGQIVVRVADLTKLKRRPSVKLCGDDKTACTDAQNEPVASGSSSSSANIACRPSSGHCPHSLVRLPSTTRVLDRSNESYISYYSHSINESKVK